MCVLCWRNQNYYFCVMSLSFMFYLRYIPRHIHGRRQAEIVRLKGFLTQTIQSKMARKKSKRQLLTYHHTLPNKESYVDSFISKRKKLLKLRIRTTSCASLSVWFPFLFPDGRFRGRRSPNDGPHRVHRS